MCHILMSNAQNSISAGAPPATLMGELTALQHSPDPIAGFQGSYFEGNGREKGKEREKKGGKNRLTL